MARHIANMRARPADIATAALLLVARLLAAQTASPLPSPDQSAAELHRLVSGLTVTARVLVIGMHPEDEDSQLIAWLSRGRNVETAYLSVTRGEAGRDFGGEETGSALGAIRTQEVLAARRIDGAKQFFTRAYDFGFARNTREVLRRWHRDSIVGDIVAVIRAFRPHVIVAVFSDSVADGDGQHQALTLFADQAFVSAADPRRFPPSPFGAPWPVAKLYRHGAGWRIDTDEYDRVLGKTYAALAVESRAQHRSQGLFGVANPPRPSVELRRVASRIGDSAVVDNTLFGGVDTSFARLAANASTEVAAAISRLAAYRHTDARVGLQNRPLAGVPDVTIQFSRGLEWIPRGRPISRAVRVTLKNHSDRGQQFRLRVVAPKGVRVDSLPGSLRLEPREHRELFVQIRGRLEAAEREPFALVGVPTDARDGSGSTTLRRYQSGIRTVQGEYLPPIRLFPSSGEWIQPIEIDVPRNLTTLYVPGVSDDLAAALKQVGVWTTEAATAEQLLSVDLSKVSTIAIGPRAFEAQPELFSQVGRLLEFLRKGGTLVLLRGDNVTVSSRLFPYSLTLARPVAERVVHADAPVTVLDPKARLLNWPNRISNADWSEWVGERAQLVPSIVDPRYTQIVEVHDPGESENLNSILVARIGKGALVYTTLTLDQQIAGGVPGALRLMVNLLSVGLSPAR